MSKWNVLGAAFQEKSIDFEGKSVIETTLYSDWFHESKTTGFDYQWMMKPKKCSGL
jgi:hypothetical protein